MRADIALVRLADGFGLKTLWLPDIDALLSSPAARLDKLLLIVNESQCL